MKKIIALLLSLTLCAALLAGCGGNNDTPSTPTTPDTPGTADTPADTPDTPEEPETPETPADPAADLSPAEKIVDSYYSYSYNAGDLFMTYFFHFYPEIPGFGAVYYAGFAMNQITFSGTYEVVEQETEYACWATREDVQAAEEGAAPPTGTAPYAINFYDMDGNLVDSCAFDGDNLYEDMEAITGIGGGNAVYARDVDPENSALKADYDGEKAASLLSLISPEDETCTLDLLVNGKYNDAVIMFVEGTYSMNEDQSEITLTPKADSDNGATVTKNEDGTYTYTSTDGTSMVLEVVGVPKVLAFEFVGEVPVPGQDGMMGDLICDIYDDNTVRVYASAFGTEMDVDAGTCDIDMTTYTINLHLDNAGDLATYSDESGMHIDYVAAGIQPFGDIDSILTMGGGDAAAE